MVIEQGKIDRAKAKYGEIYLVEVKPLTKGDDPLQYLLKAPERKVLAASAKLATSDPLQATEVMLKNCIIEGDIKALDDNRIFLAVSAHLQTINKPRVATLKKI